MILGLTAFLFFTIEQSRIAGNMAKSRNSLAQNNAIKNANSMLEASKQELQEEEEEYVAESSFDFSTLTILSRLVNLYSKWLDEDSSELELSQEQLAQLKEQLKSVTGKISANSEQLGTKDLTLAEKEKRLTVRTAL